MLVAAKERDDVFIASQYFFRVAHLSNCFLRSLLLLLRLQLADESSDLCGTQILLWR